MGTKRITATRFFGEHLASDSVDEWNANVREFELLDDLERRVELRDDARRRDAE